MEEKNCHYAEIWVSGVVQGVFFRKYTQETAQKLGLVGYVQNLPDGRVYAKVSGVDNDIKQLLSWLWDGSPKSQVSTIYIQKTEPFSETYTDFAIKR